MNTLDIRYQTPAGNNGRLTILMDGFFPTTKTELKILLRTAKMGFMKPTYYAERMLEHCEANINKAQTKTQWNQYTRNLNLLHKFIDSKGVRV